jgi:signal transduction histidine kinase
MNGETIQILLVEDNPDDAELLQEIIAEADNTPCSLFHVERLKDALICLSKNPFDVILLDLSLPDKQGLETVAQTYSTAPDLPIVVLTGLNDQVMALEALRQGAQDYLVKGKIDSNLLFRAIHHAIERAHTLKRLRQSEEQLQRLNEDLESRVAEQTNQLRQKNQFLQAEISHRQQLEEELRQALVKEKELSSLKSNIISVVSHEYRTPLSTILSSTELLEYYGDKWTKEKKQLHFQRIQSAVHHLTRLVNDVLVLNKTETGTLPFKPFPLDLLVLCRKLVAELELTINTQHQILFKSQGLSRLACLDEQLLRQLLTNLLSNAIKYSSPEDEIKFEVIWEQDTVTFKVCDRGIGIAKDEQTQLFDAFYRGSNVGIISGTGLGLAIVKKCVDLHNGQITVASNHEIGTIFTVTLPLDLILSESNQLEDEEVSRKIK